MTQYVGLIQRDENSAYDVSFPDLPGLCSQGETVRDALLSAQSALARHLRGLAADGGNAPLPTPIGRLMDDERLDKSIAVLVKVARETAREAA